MLIFAFVASEPRGFSTAQPIARQMDEPGPHALLSAIPANRHGRGRANRHIRPLFPGGPAARDELDGASSASLFVARSRLSRNPAALAASLAALARLHPLIPNSKGTL